MDDSPPIGRFLGFSGARKPQTTGHFPTGLVFPKVCRKCFEEDVHPCGKSIIGIEEDSGIVNIVVLNTTFLL